VDWSAMWDMGEAGCPICKENILGKSLRNSSAITAFTSPGNVTGLEGPG
jgi:hypothetical protein